MIQTQLLANFFYFAKKVVSGQVFLAISGRYNPADRNKRAKLVVHMYLNAKIGQLFAKVFPILMSATRAAMQAKKMDIAFTLCVGPQMIPIV